MTQPLVSLTPQSTIQSPNISLNINVNKQALSFADEIQKALSTIKLSTQTQPQKASSVDIGNQNIRAQALIPNTITGSSGQASANTGQNSNSKKKSRNKR
jgi:hypothetical protein